MTITLEKAKEFTLESRTASYTETLAVRLDEIRDALRGTEIYLPDAESRYFVEAFGNPGYVMDRIEAMGTEETRYATGAAIHLAGPNVRILVERLKLVDPEFWKSLVACKLAGNGYIQGSIMCRIRDNEVEPRVLFELALLALEVLPQITETYKESASLYYGLFREYGESLENVSSRFNVPAENVRAMRAALFG